jgi:hypothetical protein
MPNKADRRKKRHKLRVKKVVAKTQHQNGTPQYRVRGKGTRPARIHRTVRLDTNLAAGIAKLSKSWECPESKVIRHLLRSGLEVALHKPQ